MFLKSISNFRGLAIILIVAGHLYDYGFTSDDVFSSVIRNIITGGTALFVFISGFMFHYVFYKRYEYKKFMINKIKNVGVPYFFLGSMAIILLFLYSGGYFKPVELLNSEQYTKLYPHGIAFNLDDSNTVKVLKYYFTGSFLTAYWYIPFALLLFSTAPIHFRFVNFKLKNQILITIFLSIVAVFVHRPVHGTNPIHSLVYYTPVYLIGILVSMYSAEVKKYLNNKVFILMFFVVLISYIEYLSGHQGNYTKPFFEYSGIDLQYIQKIALIFLLYVVLEKKKLESKILDTISNTSFAIFFIHPWLITIIGRLNVKFNILPISASSNIILYCFCVILVLLLSVLLALIIKIIFSDNKNTRYLIGY